MSAIHEVPFTHKPKPAQESKRELGHKRGLSNVEMADAVARDTGQKEAEKTGGIVAVAEIPIDISESYGGADFDSRSILTSRQNDDGANTSYFFPEGRPR
jgi:hypothetical protein